MRATILLTCCLLVVFCILQDASAKSSLTEDEEVKLLKRLVNVLRVESDQSEENRAMSASEEGTSDSDEDRSYEEEATKEKKLNQRIFDCKKKGEGCRGFPRCCNNLRCDFGSGIPGINEGKCVECGKSGVTCLSNKQCCPTLHCVHSGIKGTCQRKGGEGDECSKDSQCMSDDCKKSWYRTKGKCT